MDTRRIARTLMLASFLLLLASQLYAYPHRIRQSFWITSDEDELGIVSRTFTQQNLNDNRTWYDLMNTRNEDLTSEIIETSMKNGDLLNATSWNNTQRAPRKGIPRDTTWDQDTQAFSTSLRPRTTETPQGQGGQRRLFGGQNGSSMTDSTQSDGKIVFPTDDDVIGKPHKFSSGPVPVCHGATFCERAAFYPEDLINQAIQLNDTLKFLAGVDVVPELEQRIDVMDDVPLCVSTEHVIYPQSAENKRKEWLFVVNQDNFKQGIRIETCSNENKECSVIDGLAEGYRTACKQKYIYRQLAAISSDGKVVPDMFRFPSSCCCHVKFTGNPLTRIGLIGVERSQTPVPKSRRRK